MDVITRFLNWITFILSTVITSMGVMTQKEWIAAIGVLMGCVTAYAAWKHRQRVERMQQQHNAMLQQLLDAIARNGIGSREQQKMIDDFRAGKK